MLRRLAGLCKVHCAPPAGACLDSPTAFMLVFTTTLGRPCQFIGDVAAPGGGRWYFRLQVHQTPWDGKVPSVFYNFAATISPEQWLRFLDPWDFSIVRIGSGIGGVQSSSRTMTAVLRSVLRAAERHARVQSFRPSTRPRPRPRHKLPPVCIQKSVQALPLPLPSAGVQGRRRATPRPLALPRSPAHGVPRPSQM